MRPRSDLRETFNQALAALGLVLTVGTRGARPARRAASPARWHVPGASRALRPGLGVSVPRGVASAPAPAHTQSVGFLTRGSQILGGPAGASHPGGVDLAWGSRAAASPKPQTLLHVSLQKGPRGGAALGGEAEGGREGLPSRSEPAAQVPVPSGPCPLSSEGWKGPGCSASSCLWAT